MRYFVAVAEEMHFGKAAARLQMTQPPLSQQIHNIEVTLRVRLFERTKRGVVLTEAGLLLLQQARLILAHSTGALTRLEHAYRRQAQRLSVGLCPAADPTLVSDILRSYARRFPQFRMRLYELEAAEQVALLRQGQLDAGIIRLPVADEALIVEPLHSEPLAVAVAESHEFARAGRLALSALADQPFIFLPRRLAPAFYDMIAGQCRRAGFALDPAHEAVGLRAALCLAAAGLGLTLVPASAVELGIPGVVFVDLEPPAPRLELGFACRPEDRSQVLRALLGVIREVAARDHMSGETVGARRGLARGQPAHQQRALLLRERSEAQ